MCHAQTMADNPQVSFYYHDLTATLGPSEVTGIMELTMPPEGIEIDLKVRLLPNTETGLAERERIKGYHKIENVRSVCRSPNLF
jgi:hypothetical protein